MRAKKGIFAPSLFPGKSAYHRKFISFAEKYINRKISISTNKRKKNRKRILFCGKWIFIM